MVDFAKLATAKKATVLPADSPIADATVATAVRQAIAESDELTDALDHNPIAATVMETIDGEDIRETLKLDRLVADDFPFDPSQLDFIDGIVNHLYPTDGSDGGSGACGTGAAGTGKTTCTKAVVDRLLDSTAINRVDMETYHKSSEPDEDEDEDEEETPTRFVASIAMVGFTGRSTQMIKKNFPRSWHANIMTIHRLLAYMPVWDEYYDDESGSMKKRMHFEPTYNADNKMPWDIIIIDEAGMVGLELWENLRLAMKDTCKIIMIGDINQLPPVHGRSVFGFAMAKWPSWELTHIHRQQGEDNAIVDNAWRVLRGQMPVSGGKFQIVPVKGLAPEAAAQIRKFLPALAGKGIYDPIRDTTITAINGHDGSRGYQLGQIPLNQHFALAFNATDERFIIDAGRERQKFAVGDKVMATKNDHEQGITNGMTGIITGIARNPQWTGDEGRFGTVAEVAAYMADVGEIEHEEVDLESIMADYSSKEEQSKKNKEAKDRGPASHIVTVQFGGGEHGFEIAFATLSEVASLAMAYVVTCHKMQGGESPVVVIICHDAHRSMLYREWLYTAITRASQQCILLCTDQALRTALSKQRITGSTLAQKVAAFNRLASESGLLGPAVRVNLGWGGRVESFSESDLEGAMDATDPFAKLKAHTGNGAPESASLPAIVQEPAKPALNFGALSAKVNNASRKPDPKPEPKVTERVVIVEREVHHHHHTHTESKVVDKGELYAQQRKREIARAERLMGGMAVSLSTPASEYQKKLAGDLQTLQSLPTTLALPQRRIVSTRGAYDMLTRIENAQAVRQRALTYAPIQATVDELAGGKPIVAERKVPGLAFLFKGK